MRFKMFLVAVLCFATQGAVAQSLDQVSGQSAYVRYHMKSLKRNLAVSAYAGTKPYCPSNSWHTRNSSSNRLAKEGYRKDVSRVMKLAGFSAQAIEHCVNNSGYVFENGQLRSHPKNTSYLRYVQAGIMVYRKRGEAAIGSMPVLVEVSPRDEKYFRVYDGSFKEICAITDTDPDIRVKCGSFGSLSGHWTKSRGRSIMTGSNSAFEVIFVTERTLRFAKDTLRNTYGG